MSRANAISPAIYLGEETIAGNGASQNATIPAGTQTIWITAEGGLARATVNGVATANSGTYAPDGTPRLIGPFSNFTSLGVFCATGVSAHLIFEG